MENPCNDGERPSTTRVRKDGKIRRPPTGKSQRRKAAPHPSGRRLGMATPVTIQLTFKGGAEGWYEVRDHRGRAFFIGDITVHSLVQTLITGGYRLAPEKGGR